MCYRRIKKAHRQHKSTSVSEQGRQTKIRRIRENREEQDFAIESIREWLHQEQLRSIFDIHEIIEEAYERVGLGRAFSGNDFRTARRSLNLLAQDFANRGINLWTIEESTLPHIWHSHIYSTSRYCKYP